MGLGSIKRMGCASALMGCAAALSQVALSQGPAQAQVVESLPTINVTSTRLLSVRPATPSIEVRSAPVVAPGGGAGAGSGGGGEGPAGAGAPSDGAGRE